MNSLQKLYDGSHGLDFKEGGLISYPRTDSRRIEEA
jgi:DNA topoisomerase IA